MGATPSYFDVNVKSRGASEKYLEQLAQDGIDLDEERQRFYEFKPARERFQEFAGTDQLADQGSGAGFGKTCKEKLEQVNLNMDVPCQHSVVFMATDGCDLRDVQSFFKKP